MRLAKRTSNLFRPRAASGVPGLDVSGLGGVVSIDPVARTADVQGMCTYEDLVDVTLQHGLMPLVVPQLRTITLGGAVTGLGIESTSFRNGLPHESVLEMDVFTGAGEVVTATPDNEHADLFATFPNSYGSLGYATRLRIELEPIAPVVALRHVRFDDLGLLAKTVAEITETRTWEGEQVDGLDGVVFAPGEAYLTLARWAEAEPGVRTSDYTGSRSTSRASGSARPTCSAATTTCGAGTPTGSGAPARSGCTTRGCGGCGRGAGAAPTSTTGWSASTTGSASCAGSTRARVAPSASAWCRTSRCPSSGCPSSSPGSTSGSACARCGSARCGCASPTAPAAPAPGRRTRCAPARRTSTSASGAPSTSAPTRPGGATNRAVEEKVARARRPQVAVLRGLLRPRDVRPALRRRQPGPGQAALRPRVTGSRTLYEKAVTSR